MSDLISLFLALNSTLIINTVSLLLGAVLSNKGLKESTKKQIKANQDSELYK